MRSIVLFILCGPLFGSLLFAQNSVDSVRLLDEVIVVGNSYKEVIPSQRLSSKQLESLNSFSVADAIRYFAGVQIKDYGGVGGLKTVDIRSMGTNHMGVFYDGIQLGNAQNGQIDLGKFSLDNIEEISLYNGQKSEIFQPAKDFGSAGTIYLKTKSPEFVGEKRDNVKLVIRTGSFGLMNPSVLWEHKLSDVMNMSLNTEYTSATGKYKFRYKKVYANGIVAWDTTAVRENGDIQSLRVEGGLNRFGVKSNCKAKFYFYDSERGIPGAIVNNVWKRSQRQWDRNFFAQGSYKMQVTPKYDLMFNFKYANDYMRYLNPDTTLMYIDNEFIQQEIYFSVANKYSISPVWDVSFSTDYIWNTLDASLRNFVYPRRNTLLIAAATALSIGPVKAQASILETFVDENVNRQRKDSSSSENNQSKAADNLSELTPAVFFSYKPFFSKELYLRAFYKRIFRMPTFNDLYYTDIGNITLKPEYTTQYNIGTQYSLIPGTFLNNLTFKADFYYIEVTDKIIAVPKGNGQYRWLMMNLGYVKIHGADLSMNAVCQSKNGLILNINAVCTYQRAQDFTNPNDNDPEAGTYGGQIAYIPRISGSTIVNMSYKSWNMNYSFIYVGERYHNSSNIKANYEQPWYTHDMTIGKKLRFKRIETDLSLEVNNIFDQQYDVVLNYPMPGRNYKLIFKFKI